MIPRATYRLQLTGDFPFAAAEAIVPYLADLGISHVYASPITMARQGSTHGYDVVDPTRINPELGGEPGFRSLVTALRARDMGLVIDIVPNHMGVAGDENPWWNDVLRLGRGSRYAGYFDIDWNGPLILPILGATLSEAIASGDLKLMAGDDPHLLLYGGRRLPLRPDTPLGEDLRVIADAQHYRLVHWRTANDSLNWRRFFSINELAGLRIEDPAVFDATHRLYLDLYREGLIDGLRIDHVDGLTDPAGYCRRLRGAMDAIRPGAWIVVEKILGADEALPSDWGMDGTSGYDFMRDATALLHAPEGQTPLTAMWQGLEPSQADMTGVVGQAKRDMLCWQFEAQLAACAEAFVALWRVSDDLAEAVTPAMVRRAITCLLQVFPVYRTYGDGRSAPPSDKPVRQKVWDDVQPLLPPGEAPVARRILDWLAGDGHAAPDRAAEAVRRFQQLSAPIAAKGIEDTAFYRCAPLLSANDVGSEPGEFAISPDLFHRRVARRSADFPHALLATGTHDHKRGEDVRARLAVLSAIPDEWEEAVTRWTQLADRHGIAIHPADRYQLFQTIVGIWPITTRESPTSGLGDRIGAWQQKALREARLRSSWEAPDTDYEASARALLDALLADDPFTRAVGAFVARIAPAAEANSLVQTALKYCVPGVPDLYQGAELFDLSLVDPDNRRPVDFALRQSRIDAPPCDGPTRKLALIRFLLGLRTGDPTLFSDGAYRPLAITGSRAGHMLAFERRLDDRRLLCAVLLRAADTIIASEGALPGPDWWADTRIEAYSGLEPAVLFAAAPFFITQVKDASPIGNLHQQEASADKRRMMSDTNEK
ncbi:malto-oligosyltrehalose synthase [Sphingobium ummariense]